jgi:hypothetical protein
LTAPPREKQYETFNYLNLPKRQKDYLLVLFSLLIFSVGIRHQFALVFAPSLRWDSL